MNIGTIKNTNSNKILFHVTIWTFFILTSLIQFYESPFRFNNDFYVQWITGITLFYLNYFYLVPVLLLEKKYWLYFVFVLALILFFMIIRITYFIPEFNHLRLQNMSLKMIPPDTEMFFHDGKAKVVIHRQPLFLKLAHLSSIF